MLVAREPRPDAPEWPGRRSLAAVDAVIWPLMWVLLIRQVPGPAGLVGPFVTALAVLPPEKLLNVLHLKRGISFKSLISLDLHAATSHEPANEPGQYCASCHGDKGQGVSGIYPALAGNRAVTLPSHNNLVQVIRQGGFMPTTSGNPQPFGMPPFGQVLNNDAIAAVTTYIRQSWANSAAPVSPLDVLHVR